MNSGSIGDITEVIIDYRGKTPPKSPTGIKLLTAKVVKDGTIDEGRLEYISEETYARWMRRGFPQQGDILLTTEAPLGEVAVLRSTEPIALAQRVILLRGDPALVDQYYFFVALRSPLMQNRLLQRATGTTVLGIKQRELRQVQVPLPPLSTQRKIAAIVSTYDDHIENNNRRINLLGELAQCIYHEWFVDFRYPGHDAVALVDSELGLIPDGWEVRRLDEIANVTRGLSWDREQEVESGGHPVITIPNVQKRLQLHGMTRLAGVSPSTVERFSLAHGDTVLVGSNGNPERVGHAVWIPSGTDVLVASFLMRVRADPSKMGPAILHMQLKDPRLTSAWRSSAIGSTSLRNIRLTTLRASSVLVPAAAVRTRGQAELQDVLDLQDALDRESAVLRATRDRLLPRLISGEVDVTDLDIAMPEAVA